VIHASPETGQRSGLRAIPDACYTTVGIVAFPNLQWSAAVIRTTTAFTLLVCASAVRADEPVPEVAALLKKAAPYRPATSELAWRQIPWHADPAAALKQARDEKRPLLVWLAGGRDRDGTPLERC
jgi:hypothetical protein